MQPPQTTALLFQKRPRPSSTLFPYTTLFRSLHVAFIAPRTLAEERLAAVWREVLGVAEVGVHDKDRKSTRLNSSHRCISYAVFCLKKKQRRNFCQNANDANNGAPLPENVALL